MDKGVPLPEIPVDPIRAPSPNWEDRPFPMFPGILLTAFGGGAMVALFLLPTENVAQANLADAAAACPHGPRNAA